MKRIVLNILLVSLFIQVNGQVNLEKELQKKLQGKTNFQEIKHLTLDYLNNQTIKKSNEKAARQQNKNLKHLNRKFWIDEFYIGQDGKYPNRAQIDYEAVTKLNKESNKKSNVAQSNPWILEGPIDIVNNIDGLGDRFDGIGRMDHIAFHPTNSNIMWAGSPVGGLFKTTNQGTSWFPLTTYLPALGVAGIVVHPNNANIIYVISGDTNSGDGNNFGLSNQGVFKTTDGGSTWAPVGLVGSRLRDVIIHPTNPSILLVAADNGIWRTSNSGATWTRVFSSHFITDIEFKKGSPSVVFAVSNDNYFRSTNTGASFSEITISGLTNAGGNRMVIGTTKDNPNRIYLFSGPTIDDNGDGDPDRFQGFYSSNNGGASFSLVTQTPVLFIQRAGRDVLQSGYDIAIAINPNDQNDIYVGGLVVWNSKNGGVTWTQVSRYYNAQLDYMHPDMHDLEFNPVTNSLFVANDGGIYKQSDTDDDDWFDLFYGLSAATFYKFEWEDDGGDIWGGTQDNGVLVQDSGSDFFHYTGGDGYDVMTDHPYLVDNGESNDVFWSVNKSIGTDGLGSDRSVPGNTEFFANLAMSPVDEDDIYAGYSHGLYYSTNSGSDWSQISSLPANWCISTCRSNVNIVYYAGHNNAWGTRLSKRNGSSNSGITTALVNAGYSTNLKITDIDVSRTDHNKMYVSIGGTNANSKVFFTNNGGISFNNLTHDLPNVPIFCVKTDELTGIYAGTSIGVYYLPFGSNHWQPFYNGLPNVAVTEIELAPGVPPYNKVYASTYGRGIWSTDTYDNCVNSLTKTGNVQGQQFFEAGTLLTSTQVLSGGQYTELKLNSGNRIRLLPGFHAPTGHYMKTYLEGCGGDVLDN